MKEAKDRAVSSVRRRAAMMERESKLEEMAALRKSHDSQIAEKDRALAREHA